MCPVAPSSFISIVDDDESCRESVVDYVRCLGFAAEGFSSAEAFLASERLRETKCLVLDIRMPGMDGLSLQRLLHASHPEIPIIFISAHGDDETRARALRGGAIDCLRKPFVADQLGAAIQAAVGRSEPQ